MERNFESNLARKEAKKDQKEKENEEAVKQM